MEFDTKTILEFAIQIAILVLVFWTYSAVTKKTEGAVNYSRDPVARFASAHGRRLKVTKGSR